MRRDYITVNSQRKKERRARSRNRIRIGIILLSLFVLLIIAFFFTRGYYLWPAGFFVVTGGAYLGAGLWEKKELDK